MHPIEPSSFYGANRATLDLVRNIRLSRLTSTVIDSKTLNDNEKGKRNRSSSEKGSRASKPKIKTVKLFPGIKHGVKKPKQKIQQVKERGQKRKFFKSTIPVEEHKKTELSPSIDFDDFNDVEEEPAVKVSKIIQHIDWSDDEEYMKPQLTRQKAVALSNEVHNLSYITPTEPLLLSKQITNMISYIKPTEPVTPTTPCNKNVENSPKTYVELKNCSVAFTTPSPRKTTTDENTPRTPVTGTPKYYSIFTSPVASNVLSDVTNKRPKCKTSLMKAASPNDQYQIDAGQKMIGPTECKKCGMVYDKGDPIDEQRHKKFHLSKTEVKYKYSETDIVGKSGADEIVLIHDTDSKLKVEKVHSILKLTEDEIGTGYSLRTGWKAFVCVRHGSVIGCVITEPISEAHRISHSDGIALLSEESYQVKCGINRIWVKRGFRGQKIATNMMNCLRKNYIYGAYMGLDDIAFSVTTDEGNEFAKKYTGRNDYLAYSG